MNGAHDLGGKHGYGSVDQSQQENFVHPWEERVFALTLACGMLGRWNMDQSRYARERADPLEYLAGSYYEHWLHGLERLLLEQGLITAQELRTGIAEQHAADRAVTPERVDEMLASGGPTLLPDDAPALFNVGDTVVVRTDNTTSHTRAPDYVKGKAGRIVNHHGSHVYADEHAASGVKKPAHLYCVCFAADTLWGDTGCNGSSVHLDLFEPYLLSLQQHIALLQGLQ